MEAKHIQEDLKVYEQNLDALQNEEEKAALTGEKPPRLLARRTTGGASGSGAGGSGDPEAHNVSRYGTHHNMSNDLTEDVIQEYQEAFQLFDKDGNGHIEAKGNTQPQPIVFHRSCG